MKIKIDNNWTVLVEDLDLRTASSEEINTLGTLVATNTLVILRNQQLTPQDEVDICSKFGSVEQIPSNKPTAHPGYWIKDTDNKVMRVSGELDEHGLPGLFGHISDLDWHCNSSASPDRKPIVWLYGVKGTEGSRTSWINNILSYEALQAEDPEFFNEIKDLKMVCGYERGRYSENAMTTEDRSVNPYFNPSLVHTNIAGKTGLYCSPLQIFYFVGMTEEQSLPILEKLRDFIIQERFMYHHDWQDNDVIISEQWLGIHKRWKFENINKRELHRVCVDFSNIKFN